MIAAQERYSALYEQWKILFDYVSWVKDGGEALYGDINTAMAWRDSLMIAMNELMKF